MKICLCMCDGCMQAFQAAGYDPHNETYCGGRECGRERHTEAISRRQLETPEAAYALSFPA